MTVELWLHLEHGVPRMSDPMNERPGDPQPPPPEAERKSSSPLIWILILIALIAFAWYFYNRKAGSESIGDLAPPRSEERRVGKESVRTCRSRWSPSP